MNGEQNLTKDKLLKFLELTRLSRCGIQVPPIHSFHELPEHDLFRLLSVEHGPEAYRHYRSLLRRLVSLENALEGQAARE